MQLRRGVERASCDFCRGRKMKCDRSARAEQGHDSCSQCALRQVLCQIRDSDDIRTRKRGRDGAEISRTQPVLEQQRQVERNGAGYDGRRTSDRRATDMDRNASTTDEQAEPSLHRALATPPIEAAPLEPPVETTTILQQKFDQTTNLDSLFELGPGSVSFLGQVFEMEDYSWDLPEWTGQESTSANQDEARATDHDGAESTSTGFPAAESHAQDSGRTACVDAAIFDAALHAYFEFAAHCLPIVYEDAFWLDYHAGRCSQALTSAVACLGMPFTAGQDKWRLQQELASKFRESILQAQHTVDRQGPIRLDDLEALAMMVNFEYDDANSSALDSRLGSLFLTHDSLVLMTLEARVQKHALPAQGPSSLLARAEERRTLLFWHVYGLDAFHGLDRKRISRIQDDHIEFADQLSLQHSGGYLDTILALAIVARRITQTLCNARAKRKGVGLDAVVSLYEDLSHWRKVVCPSSLQWLGIDANQPRSTDGEKTCSARKTGDHTQLHRAVLALLELNCYMQIESCVVQYGTQREASLENEMLALRVDYETLRAINGILTMAPLLTADPREDMANRPHSLVDMAPRFLRDICAGVCTWLCLRGQTSRHRILPGMQEKNTSSAPEKRRDGGGEAERQRLASYAKGARTLRDVVATATSHQDTAQIVSHLERQLELMQELG